MNASVNILCYKSKTLADGSHPIMIRVCKDGKKKYHSLGIAIQPCYWDFKKNKPKRNCPNKAHIDRLIADKLKEYARLIIEMNSENKSFTATTLVEKANGIVVKTVEELFSQHIDYLKTNHRQGYALTFQEVYNSLVKYNGHLHIYFSDIDIEWLKCYETWLRGQGFSENTIGRRFRTLRALYNVAIEKSIVKAEYYPFDVYKVSKLHKATAKRSISKEEIMQVINFRSDHAYTQLAIDLFSFSYFMGGINFVDMAYLTTSHIVDGRLVYTRKKTGKLIRLPLQPKAVELIEKYKSLDTRYLFPILSKFHNTEQRQRNRIHKVITNVNKYLKKVGQELDIPIDLTTYVARHSFATVLKRSGVSTSLICESLGHSSEKVTQIYLDSFENSQIDEAMKNLL